MQKLATVQHWEPSIPAQLDGVLDAVSVVRKTRDPKQTLVSEIFETNGQTRWEVCAAPEGSPMAVHVKDGVTGVCAGDAVLDLSDTMNPIVATVDRMRLLEALPFLRENFVLQGELSGAGAGGSRAQALPKFFVLDIYDIDRGVFLPPTQRKALVALIVAEQRRLGVSDLLEHAPVLDEHVTLADLGVASLDKLTALANAGGPERQGVVFRRFDGRFGFKVLRGLAGQKS